MVNTRCILKYKIALTEAVVGYGYCIIEIKNYGRGIIVRDIDAKEFRKLIKEENFTKASKDDYAQFSEDGAVYTDGVFKKFLNKHPLVKKNLYKILDKLDEC